MGSPQNSTDGTRLFHKRISLWQNPSVTQVSRNMKNEETSYPREKIKVLLLENVSGTAVEAFTRGGYPNVERLSRALGEDELAEAVKGVHILGIRSKTKVT